MRTTSEIIAAVRNCEPVTDEEMRMCIAALANVEWFLRSSLQKLVDALDTKGPAQQRLRADSARATLESMHRGMRTPVDRWLGPHNIPGTPEYTARISGAKALLKKATGVDMGGE